MLSWIIIILGLLGSFHYSDLESQSVLYTRVCPVLVAVFLIALLVKVISSGRAHKGAGGSYSDGGDSGWFFGDSGDSRDSGGSCDGGGGGGD